jgi:hypothetical protein
MPLTIRPFHSDDTEAVIALWQAPRERLVSDATQ